MRAESFLGNRLPEKASCKLNKLTKSSTTLPSSCQNRTEDPASPLYIYIGLSGSVFGRRGSNFSFEVIGNTFRHSYATLLIASGENIRVVQELMRHGSARITVEIYSQARSPAKRAAQERLVQMILPEDRSEPVIPS